MDSGAFCGLCQDTSGRNLVTTEFGRRNSKFTFRQFTVVTFVNVQDTSGNKSPSISPDKIYRALDEGDSLFSVLKRYSKRYPSS